MRRFQNRDPKKYVWVASSVSGAFESSNVLTDVLVDGADFTTGPIVAQSHILNIIRIIGSICIVAREPGVFDDIADFFVSGPVAWGIFVQDQDNLAPLDPDSPTSYGDEPCLAVGYTPSIGILLDVNAQVGGTGLSSTFGHSVPYSYLLEFDIRSNRRLNNDQQLILNLTRAVNGLVALSVSQNYNVMGVVRTLVKLP